MQATLPRGAMRIGTDIIAIADVERSLGRFGRRYTRRLFTDQEVADSGGPTSPVLAAGLAARFAAKEATIKALRPGGAAPPWRSIEITREPAGWTSLVLTGAAAELAERAGVCAAEVSLSHDAGVGLATVVLTVVPPEEPVGAPHNTGAQ